MQVVGYCARCPLRMDMLADVRGRQCPWGCKDARQEHPPYTVEIRALRSGERWGMCPGCGMLSITTPAVLDTWTRCYGNFKTGGCQQVFLVKGTGSWIRKLVTWWSLPSQTKRERRLSHLWP